MKRFFLGLACAASFLASMAPPANAQGGPDPLELLERADINGDGKVTRAEVQQTRETSFARLDRNGDGFADQSDRPRVGGPKFDEAMRNVAQADANRDGRISRSEFVNAPSPGFDAADTNRDQVVTAAETEALRASRSK